VAVVIQYRLGPSGFLHGGGLFDGEFCADNRGFLDQLCALQWVQQNIVSFGGDPACVTVFGQSAGAFSVYQLAASPKAKGLFRRAIAMGGMAQTCAPAGEYHQATHDALGDVGIVAGDQAALAALDKPKLQALHAAYSKRVLRGGKDQYGSLSRERLGFLGAATGTDFLPQSPLQAYASGETNKIDLMLGTCANDGGLFSLIFPFGRTLSARLFSKLLLGYAPNADMKAMRRHYRAEMRHASTGRILEQINNDAFYRAPTNAVAKAHAIDQPGTAYLYQLDYSSAIGGLGAIHAIDVALLFRNPPMDLLLQDDAPTRQLSELMLEAWTQFAKTGKPAAAGLPAWAPFDADKKITMVFDRQSKPVSDLDSHLLRFWQ
jgi:carboxylesterase type B